MPIRLCNEWFREYFDIEIIALRRPDIEPMDYFSLIFYNAFAPRHEHRTFFSHTISLTCLLSRCQLPVPAILSWRLAWSSCAHTSITCQHVPSSPDREDITSRLAKQRPAYYLFSAVWHQLSTILRGRLYHAIEPNSQHILRLRTHISLIGNHAFDRLHFDSELLCNADAGRKNAFTEFHCQLFVIDYWYRFSKPWFLALLSYYRRRRTSLHELSCLYLLESLIPAVSFHTWFLILKYKIRKKIAIS
jgi:hypothetical protein